MNEPDRQDLSKLKLSGWPFQTVPDETFSTIWADRVELMQELTKMLHRWVRVGKSTIHLMWADLGAGKTHTLRHINGMCLGLSKPRMLPVYAVMPKYVRSFFEVYQAIISSIDLPSLSYILSVYLGSDSRRREAAKSKFLSIPDAVTILHVLGIGSDLQRNIAAEWMRGSRGLTRRHLDSLGVTRQIRTSDDAVAVLSGLVQVIHSAGLYHRVVIMLDECQRIGNFKLSIGRDINTGIQTWYDSNPNNLTLIMSFGTGEEKFVRHLLSPELLSRVDHQRIRLDLLTRDEALQFIRDLFERFRQPGSDSDYFPLSEELVVQVIERLVRKGGITPRELMKAFDKLLSDADYLLSTTGKYTPDTEGALRQVERIVEELSEAPEE